MTRKDPYEELSKKLEVIRVPASPERAERVLDLLSDIAVNLYLDYLRANPDYEKSADLLERLADEEAKEKRKLLRRYGAVSGEDPEQGKPK